MEDVPRAKVFAAALQVVLSRTVESLRKVAQLVRSSASFDGENATWRRRLTQGIRNAGSRFKAALPILRWLPAYDRERDLPGDLTAAVVVAIMLIPQSMAYAMLAGLSPQTGLYASILPLVFYACFGTSQTLAVGPVAIVSLMVASALTPLAVVGSPEFHGLALVLALLSGLILILLGLLRIGFLVNFLSHLVLSGFTTAAAIVIGVSQLRDLAGITFANSTFIPAQILSVLAALPNVNPLTLAIGATSIGLLWWRSAMATWLARQFALTRVVNEYLPKAMPLLLVVGFTLMAWLLGLSGWAGVSVVGAIPIGLPTPTRPPLSASTLTTLLLPAILISLVGFLESVSVGKSLASKRRQSIEPNHELVGLGAANLGAAFTGGFPVTGGLSRSVVNFSAGANTPLASIMTAALVAIAVLLLTPLLFHLPKAVLAAIVLVAVWNLVDFDALQHAWAYDKLDGAGYLATFTAVLTLGVDVGIMVGIGVSLALHLWRTSTPHIAIVGRLGETEHFRNILRHPVDTHDRLLLMRIDESLYFANAAYLEEQVLKYVAEHPKVQHFVLICSAVNAIDASALETLTGLRRRLSDMKIVMHLAEVKGPVTDRLQRTTFLDELRPGRVFMSTHEAVQALIEPSPVTKRHRPVIINGLRKTS